MPASLPRRALIGVALGPDDGSDGLAVSGVLAESMAARAGVEPGDRLLRVGDHAIVTAADAVVAARTIAKTERVRLVFARGEATLEADVAVTPRPLERVEGAEVLYGQVTVEGRRLRTLTTLPPRPAPAVLILQGIARTSIEFAGARDAPLARLVDGLSEAGFATARVEKWGVGDSEGEPEGADLARELAAFRAAFDALAARPTVSRVFAFGHSLGGMEVPLLDRALAGAVVYGTSSRRWSECMRRSAERQLRLRGWEEDAVAERVAGAGARSYGVSPRLLAQLEAAQLAAAWARFDAPTLVLHGEHDWVVSWEESEEIAALAPRASARSLPRVDHAMGAHADLAASLERYGGGAADTQVLEATVAHVRGILAGEATA